MDTSSIVSTAQALGTSANFFAAGVSFASSALVISPLLPLSVSDSARIFSTLYNVGKFTQGPISSTATIANLVAAYYSASGAANGTAAALSMAPLAFTGIYMMPGISRLLSIHAMDGAQKQAVGRKEVVDLLLAWKGQNYVRTTLMITAGLIGGYTLMSGRGMAVPGRKIQ